MKANDLIDAIFANAGKLPIVNGEVKCLEYDAKAKLQEVTIVNVPNDSIVLKLEHIAMNGLVRKAGIEKEWGFNQHSDFVIVTPDKCVFIEMKSNPKLDNIKKETIIKFISDVCLMNYSDNIFTNLCQKNPFFMNRDLHFVLFHAAPPIAKVPVSFTPPGLSSPKPNSIPSAFRPFSLENKSKINFNDLV